MSLLSYLSDDLRGQTSIILIIIAKKGIAIWLMANIF